MTPGMSPYLPRAVWAVLTGLVLVGIGAGAGWLVRGEHKTAQVRDLAPPSAIVLDVAALRAASGASEVAVAWRRGDPNLYPTEFGLTVWRQQSPDSPWRQLYEKRFPFSKDTNIHDLRLHTADVTRDGRDDLLVHEDRDGSAGVYVYRLFTTDGGPVREIASRLTNEDDTTVFVEYGELVSYEAVGKDPKTALSIHCCPLHWRRTVQRWNGTRLIKASVASVETRPAPRSG